MRVFLVAREEFLKAKDNVCVPRTKIVEWFETRNVSYHLLLFNNRGLIVKVITIEERRTNSGDVFGTNLRSFYIFTEHELKQPTKRLRAKTLALCLCNFSLPFHNFISKPLLHVSSMSLS